MEHLLTNRLNRVYYMRDKSRAVARKKKVGRRKTWIEQGCGGGDILSHTTHINSTQGRVITVVVWTHSHSFTLLKKDSYTNHAKHIHTGSTCCIGIRDHSLAVGTLQQTRLHLELSHQCHLRSRHRICYILGLVEQATHRHFVDHYRVPPRPRTGRVQVQKGSFARC